MNDSDEYDSSDFNEEDQTAMDIILRLLLRNGQVRMQRRGSSRFMDYLEDDDDEEENQVSNDEETNAFIKEKLEMFKKSDFVCDIYNNCGKRLCMHEEAINLSKSLKSNANLAILMKLREIGNNVKNGCCQNFDSKSKTLTKSSLIPNTLEHKKLFQEKLFCGVYSDDGNLFLSACQDRRLRLFSTNEFSANSKPIKEFQGHDVGWSILDVAFSPDTSCIAYSSWKDSINIVRPFVSDPDAHESLLLNPEQSNLAVFSLKFSSLGNEILCGANDGFLYVYDTNAMQRTARIDAHEDDVNAVCFADKSSQILYSGADDGLVHVWDRRALKENNPEPVGILAGHRDGITFIDTKNDARYLLSNSKDQSIKLWDIRKFSTKETIDKVRQTVARQTWDYRWQGVPKSMKHRNIIQGDTSVNTYTGHKVLNTLIRARFSPMHSTGQRYIYSGCSTGKVFVFDALTAEIVSQKCEHKHTVRDVHWHPFEPEMISSSWDGVLAKWTYKSDNNSPTRSSSDVSTSNLRSKHPMQLRSRHLVKK